MWVLQPLTQNETQFFLDIIDTPYTRVRAVSFTCNRHIVTQTDNQGGFGRSTYRTSQPHFPEPHTRFFTICAVRLCFYVRCSEKQVSRFSRLRKQQTPVSQKRNSLKPRRTRVERFSLNESTGRKSRTRLVHPRVGNMKRTTNKWEKQVENYGKR
jgi:hypothetical protein